MQEYFLFAGSFLLSVATPGPDILVVVSKALVQRSAARCLALILGILGGKLLLLTAALLGLAALAMVLGPLFVAVKFVGAAYLAYLGIRLWRRQPRGDFNLPSIGQSTASEVGLGLAMSLGNPVAILFYAALLPNVIDVTSVTIASAMVLVAIVSSCTIAVYAIYAMLAARAGAFFRSPVAQQRVNRTSGAAMVGAAVLVATR